MSEKTYKKYLIGLMKHSYHAWMSIPSPFVLSEVLSMSLYQFGVLNPQPYCLLFQFGKVKMYPDIPYLLPKSYAKLRTDRSAASHNVNTVDCQVRKILCWAHRNHLIRRLLHECHTWHLLGNPVNFWLFMNSNWNPFVRFVNGKREAGEGWGGG